MHKAIQKREKYVINQLKTLDDIRKVAKLHTPTARKKLNILKEELERNIAPFILLKTRIEILEKELNND